MTAKEMFENLGYSCEENEEFITYTSNGKVIQFRLNYKDVIFNSKVNITPDIIAAVMEQYKELGWI